MQLVRFRAALLAPLMVMAIPSLPLAAQAPATPLQWQHTDPKLTWSPCPPIFPAGCEVTVLHGDPTSGPSDVYLRVPGDYTFPSHTHSSAEHLVLVKGILHVSYAGGQQSELKEGSYGLVPARLGHRAHCGGSAGCVMFIHFDSPIDAAPSPQP